LLKLCESNAINFSIIHTGQHYDYEMDKIFFEQLHLPKPDYELNIGSYSHGKQTGKMMIQLESLIKQESPSIVLVQGDTNTVLSGALVVSKLNCDLGHLEAGLRNYDDAMPEEINRHVTDHVSDLLFAPTEHAARTLSSEGISPDCVFVTGNTVVDAVLLNKEIASQRSTILSELELRNEAYAVLTIHRQENVESKSRFSAVLDGIRYFIKETQVPVIFPIHPRARAKLTQFNLKLPNGVQVTRPLGYLNFLNLQSEASVIFTDSGGVQEEACTLGVPCVTVRESTERPETIKVGANTLAGNDPEQILKHGIKASKADCQWTNPYGDGKSAHRILNILTEIYDL
jgi:UDP-N-acetylglucosamine 2-epimerase (non-hydrolysing)